MKRSKVVTVLAILLLIVAGCQGRRSAHLSPSGTSARLSPPTPTATTNPTFTPIPPDTPIPSPVPTATWDPDVVPTLPHTDVQFIYNGDRSQPFVALTFDLCQKPELPAWFDQGIYDVLTRYDVPATFFMGGDWMRTHPEETKLLASNPKFELGNHSWSHPDLPGLSEQTISSEIIKTQDILYKLTGRQARLFRLLAGLYDDFSTVHKHLKRVDEIGIMAQSAGSFSRQI